MKENKAHRAAAERKRQQDKIDSLEAALHAMQVAESERRAEVRKLEQLYVKTREERDAAHHVIVESGVRPGIDYECQCEQCLQVAKGMAAVGYLPSTSDFWWSKSNGQG